MAEYCFVVPTERGAVSMRDFLRQQGFSATQWRRIKNVGTIECNGELCAKPPMLAAGDLIKISLPVAENANLLPEYGSLKILWEDEYLLIVSKPAGMLIHPTVNALNGTLGNLVLGYYRSRGLQLSYHPLTRLDKDTSGVVIIAKNAYVQNLCSKIELQKHYLAVVMRHEQQRLLMIDKPIARKPGSIIERQVDEAAGKEAQTQLELLADYGGPGLMKVRIFTGRTHQIRVHCAYLQMPIVGDELYGGNHELIERQALHAWTVSFIHPITGAKLSVRDYLPEDMRVLLKNIREKHNS